MATTKTRLGFTIIEVMLFLGISGFLIVGLMVGTSSTVARQRYNDSVQDLAEFFRREYSAVVNPENIRGDETIKDDACTRTTTDSHKGRSDYLLYGRLVVLGQDNEGSIYSYDVIGCELDDKQKLANATNLTKALQLANLTIVVCDISTGSACVYKPIGSYKYTPQWLAKVESPMPSAPGAPAKTSLLIVRSPVNGSVRTLVLDKSLSVESAITSGSTSIRTLLSGSLGGFSIKEANFCVGSEDTFAFSGRRRNVRIASDGNNSSAVTLIDQDSEDNKCTK